MLEKKITIFGASGQTGKQLVEQTLNQGHKVTAFVRNPNRMPIKHGNLSVFKGDVLNQEDVEKAIAAHDAVFSALGIRLGDKPVCAPGIINIIGAMQKNQVSRLVAESAYGVRETRKGYTRDYISCLTLETSLVKHFLIFIGR